MSLEVSQETQARIVQEAQKEGISVDALIQRLMKEHEERTRAFLEAPASDVPSMAHLQRTNPQEWARYFDAWVDSHDPDTPVLSDEAMSRESIYPDLI